MPYRSNITLFSNPSIAQTARLAGKSHSYSTTTGSNLASATTPNAGFLRRLAATPRGRVSLAAAVVVGCVLDYELWVLYGAKYFGGKGEEN
ncbi:hypothetical protein F4678DRAFT_443560 [Xylaria arbuscula]|nr:hypothetical protein F4678DRAFT_443560 [Xylaria arbuscula]